MEAGGGVGAAAGVPSGWASMSIMYALPGGPPPPDEGRVRRRALSESEAVERERVTLWTLGIVALLLSFS